MYFCYINIDPKLTAMNIRKEADFKGIKALI